MIKNYEKNYECIKTFPVCDTGGCGKPNKERMWGVDVRIGSVWELGASIAGVNIITDGRLLLDITTEDGFFDAHFKEVTTNE